MLTRKSSEKAPWNPGLNGFAHPSQLRGLSYLKINQTVAAIPPIRTSAISR